MNNPFENTETTIKKDVREVFEEIWQELNNTYFTSDKLDLSYMRENIGKRLVTTLINKNLLLMDTVLNYLAKDARGALGDTDSKIINQFYEWNQQQAEKFKSEFKSELQPEAVPLPTDTRVFSGAVGVSGAIGTMLVSRTIGAGVVAALLPIELLLLPMGLLLSLGFGYLAYKGADHVFSSREIKQLKEGIKEHLQLVEEATLNRLLKVVEEYQQGFDPLFKK